MKKFLLLCLVFALPAGISRCVEAAAPCNVTDAGFKMGPPIRTSEGVCAVWFCSVNHGWGTYALCTEYSGLTGAVLAHISSMTKASQAQRDAEWDSLLATPPAAGSPEDRLLALALSTPTPQDTPLDGWVTQTTIVYKQQMAVGSYTMVAVGTIALGRPCDSTVVLVDASGQRYYAVARSDVTMTKLRNLTPPFPVVAYGRCN